MIDSVSRLSLARRYLTYVLLNLPIQTNETSVSTLLTMLDHFIENPDEYREFVRSKDRQNSKL